MMADKREIGRCKRFLNANGWEYLPGDPGAYHVPESFSIELNSGDDEIVFVNDTGDFLHLPLNYYALVGALVELRALKANYISVPEKAA